MLSVRAAVMRIAAFVMRWHWLILLLALPLFLIPNSLSSVVLLIVPLVWSARWVAKGSPLPRTPLNASLLVFAFMGLVSTLATFDLALSLPGISNLVLILGIYFAVAEAGRGAQGWRLLLFCFLLFGAVIAVASAVGTNWIFKIGFLSRIASVVPSVLVGLPGIDQGLHPNIVAGTLLWVLPMSALVCAFVLFKAKRIVGLLGRFRAYCVITAVTVTTAVVTLVFLLTQSRSGYLALGASVIAAVFVLAHRRNRWSFLALLVLLLVGVGVVIEAVDTNTLFGRYDIDISYSSPALSLNTFEGRLELWSRAIEAIGDFGFTGMGMNTFKRIIHFFYPLLLVSPDYDIGHAHNEFLQVALDLGIPGLIAFLALYIQAFWMLEKVWQRLEHYDSSVGGKHQYQPVFPDARLLARVLTLGLAAGLFAHMLFGLTDAVFPLAKPSFMFGLLLGLISAFFTAAESARFAAWSTQLIEV